MDPSGNKGAFWTTFQAEGCSGHVLTCTQNNLETRLCPLLVTRWLCTLASADPTSHIHLRHFFFFFFFFCGFSRSVNLVTSVFVSRSYMWHMVTQLKRSQSDQNSCSLFLLHTVLTSSEGMVNRLVTVCTKQNKEGSLAFSVPLDLVSLLSSLFSVYFLKLSLFSVLEDSTCNSNLVCGERWQPAGPFSQPEGQHGLVVFGVMEGEAVSGRGGGASAQRDGHMEPDCSFSFCSPLEQRALQQSAE